MYGIQVAMSLYIDAPFMLLCGASNLAAVATDGPSLAVDTGPGSSTRDKKYLWKFVPLFNEESVFKGFGIRSQLNGKYICCHSGMPNGGGVSLVDESQIDEWAGWNLGTPVPGRMPRYLPFLSSQAGSSPICVMTLFGGGGWGPGTQIITYQWGSGDNQTWWPAFQPNI